MSEGSGEKCQRCGEVGEDRRTLWMACLYEMSELGLPFGNDVRFRASLEQLTRMKGPTQIKLSTGEALNLTSGSVKTSGELFPEKFYTLRVCKDCRADWMFAIKGWFENPSPPEKVGSGIFVRSGGTTVEITEEEWKRLNPDREPVRVPADQRD